VLSPIRGQRSDLCYCQTAVALLIWGTLSDERMDVIYCGHSQSYVTYIKILHDGILESVVKEYGSLWIPTIYSFT
jgi:hypothetical protein